MQHRKQGELETVSNQQSHHVSSQEFQNPDSAFTRYPNSAKQTQFRPAGYLHYAKQSQSQPLWTCGRPKMRNKPKKNRRPQACLHLYNPPVPPAGCPSLSSPPHNTKMRNKPNLPSQPHCPTPKMRNKPNFRCLDQKLTTNDWRLKTAFNKTNPILTNQ